MKRDLFRQQGMQKSQFSYKWEQTLSSRSDLQPVLLGLKKRLLGSFSWPRKARGSECPPERLQPLCPSLGVQ